ncbi:concanavalin A-like lectin/glucanase domain-containing protein [Mycena maculata]|uniref:Endo-1,4-beta-xylanase n=1 Tax=Mycena maculata TaxID=230809 RepID=A0AAD7NKE2_9AGAR|nr:concanavalin A-like lectin/glucanase domain-containing protein [Mycena maculata]
MVFFSSLFVLLAATAVAAGSAKNIARSGPSNSTGTNFGYYYTFSVDDGDAVIYTNSDDGDYTIQWTENSGYFIGGKGWNPGSAQSVRFETFNAEGSSYASLYGWTTDPLVEYRIPEQNYGTNDPTVGLTLKGNVTSDGSLYNIYETQIVNAASILGVATFNQYWSIRQSPPITGTVTVGTHFEAWASLGMDLGEFNYQIVATEGFAGNGSIIVGVITDPEGPCAAEYAQCGGEGFTGPTCCISNTICMMNSLYFSQCVAVDA